MNKTDFIKKTAYEVKELLDSFENKDPGSEIKVEANHIAFLQMLADSFIEENYEDDNYGNGCI